MDTKENVSVVINPEYLATLDDIMLVDLLKHRTDLLIALRASGVQRAEYINSLKREIELIHTEVQGRKK